MGGLLLMLFGALFACLALYMSLTDGSKFTPATAILLPLFLCLFMEAGYSFFKKSVFRSENWVQAAEGDAVQRVGKGLNVYFLVKALLKNIKGFIVILIIAGGMIYFFSKSNQTLTLNREFYIQLGTYVAYALILRRFLAKIFNKLKELGQKMMTSYSVDVSGITFTLPDKDLSHPERKFTIRVDFREIEELKLLSYQEAKSYMKYEFSPDLKKLSSGPKDWYLFLKENIRPRVYTRIVSGGAALLLRGKESFYLMTVNKDNPKDILDAYERSKTNGL